MPSLNGKRPFGTYAKIYRESGFEGALPLPPKEKNPPPKGYTGGGRPYPTDEQIATWLSGTAPASKARPAWPYVTGNICLRLGDVNDEALGDRKLPSVYANSPVDGWELIGIDVDDYKGKHGDEEYRKLADEGGLGKLPATAMSSARWATWNEHRSSIRVFLVPKGFRYMGKAANSIEVIQKRHRFMVAHPSTNPDADNALYEWRWGTADMRLEELEAFEGAAIPTLATGGDDPDIAVLPEAWFNFLSRNGQAESNDPISAMTDDDLWVWAATDLRYGALPDDEEPDKVIYEPCRRIVEATEKWIADLESSTDSHTKMTPFHWEMLRLSAEGHCGAEWAMSEFHTAWAAHVLENRGGAPEDLYEEITRSVLGVLSKTEPIYAVYDDKGDVAGHLPLADDTCAVQEQVKDGKWDERVGNWGDDVESILADFDNDGMGPVVGAMETYATKPANEYGQHDRGNGTHFTDMYGANVKFVDGRDSWVLWDGERWHRDPGDRMISVAYDRVRRAQESHAHGLLAQSIEIAGGGLSEAGEGVEADLAAEAKSLKAEAKSWLSWAKRSGNVGPVKSALEMARANHVNGDEAVAVKATVFDSRPDLLGCENGVLELTANPELRAPDKADYVTFNTHTPYIPWRNLANATDEETLEGLELWIQYLDTFLPDQKVQRYVQKILGHTIIGENPEKLLVFLYGPHDTGKSTMLGAIKGAMGDYYGTVDLSLFRQKDLNPGLIRAVPLRVTAMSEVDAGTMDAATIKRLTGNDSVMAEAKYSNEIFEGRPQFTTIISCNNPPNIKHADEALNERLMVLPFMTPLERSERKYDRQSQIESHSGVAVLSWLVEGWKMYCAEGISDKPAVVRKHQAALFQDLNESQSFMGEVLEPYGATKEGKRAYEKALSRAREKGKDKPGVADWDPDWTPSASRVFELYVRWCQGNNVQPVSNLVLSKELGLGKPTPRSIEGRVQRCYMGVRIKL